MTEVLVQWNLTTHRYEEHKPGSERGILIPEALYKEYCKVYNVLTVLEDHILEHYHDE